VGGLVANLTDDFNRANESPLASPWVVTGTDLILASNAVSRSGAGVSSGAPAGGYTGSTNNYSQCKIYPNGDAYSDMGPAIRIDYSIGNGQVIYGTIYNSGGGVKHDIWSYNGLGTWTQLFTSSGGAAYTSGGLYRLRSVAGTLHFDEWNGSAWSNIGTAADPFSTGLDGIVLSWHDATSYIDDWANYDTFAGGGGATPTTNLLLLGVG
jgi:hypothetical protein